MASRRWTLNSKHGYYVATNQTDPAVLLNLHYRGPEGRVSEIGHFRLDLDVLAEKGVVTKRAAPAGDVYDVKIVHERERFVLRVREGQSIDLARFAIKA